MEKLTRPPERLHSPERPSPFEIVGMLPDWALRAHIEQGVIGIDPLRADWKERLSPISIDFRLGYELRILEDLPLDTLNTRFNNADYIESRTQVIRLQEDEPFILRPGKLILATTLERLTLPSNIVGHLGGKSSRARLGIVVHSTAALFHPGWDDHPMLELALSVSGKDIIVYPGDDICAFTFERLAWDVERPYQGRYKSGNQKGFVEDSSLRRIK